MSWTELVQAMQAAGFSPGEACILASLGLLVLRLGRRVQQLEHDVGQVRRAIGLVPVPNEEARHG